MAQSPDGDQSLVMYPRGTGPRCRGRWNRMHSEQAVEMLIWGRTSHLSILCFWCFFKQFFVVPYLKRFFHNHKRFFFFFMSYCRKMTQIEWEPFQKLPWLRPIVLVHLCSLFSLVHCFLISSYLFFFIEFLGSYNEENNSYFCILALKRLAPFPLTRSTTRVCNYVSPIFSFVPEESARSQQNYVLWCWKLKLLLEFYFP